MKKKLSEICSKLNIEFYGDPEFIIKSVSTDTRFIRDGDFFFALKGENFNGSDFIYDLKYRVSGIMIEKKRYDEDRNKIHSLFSNIVISENPNLDYLRIATQNINYERTTVIAITGSYGKTTCKYFLIQFLEKNHRIAYNEKNFNNKIGIAHTLIKLDYDPEYLILEIGSNHFGEIREIVDQLKINKALITSIGNTHLEFFGSKEGVFKEKKDLLKNLDGKSSVYINLEDKYLCRLTDDRSIKAQKIGLIPFDRSGWSVRPILRGFEVIIDSRPVILPFYGFHNIKNLYLAYSIARNLGVSDEVVYTVLNGIKLPEGRANTEILTNIFPGQHTEETLIIEDAYNSNPDSLLLFLEEIIDRFSRDRKILFILGDMLEGGKDKEKHHAGIIDYLLGRFDEKHHYIFVGRIFDSLVRKTQTINSHPNIMSFEFIEQWMEKFQENPGYFSGQVIFIKGSHGIHLEKFTQYLHGKKSGNEQIE